MPRNYSVTEPHPSVAKGYFSSGIGGAGNYKHYSPSTLTPGPNATGPAARVQLTRPQVPRVMLSGRGGAGNSRKYQAPTSPEPEIFQFDEEMMKQRGTVAPVYHFGRGGGGNFVDERKTSGAKRTASIDSGSAASVSSERSTSSSVRRTMEGAMGRLSKVLSSRSN